MQENIAGHRMSWREAGSGDPVILIHGFPFDSSIWNSQLDAVPEGWRYIAPDLRGFGESEAAGSGPFTMDVFADDVIALLDHLGIDQAVMCGLSMGGYVALSLARRYPDRVRALVFMATRANADSAEGQKIRLSQAAAARSKGTSEIVAAMLKKLFSAHSRLKQPREFERVVTMMHSQAPESVARALEGMAARKDYTAELSQINISTMIIRGAQDEIIPAADMEAIARGVRGARHEVIALSGHLPNVEAADVVNGVLENFLSQLPPPLKLGNFDLSF